MTVMIIIGYTLPDAGSGYHPMLCGYRPGAAQREVRLDLRGCGRPTHRRLLELAAAPAGPRQWAEAVFVATNAPPRALEEDPRPQVWLLRAAITTRPAVRAVMRPLSVGDTVTIGDTILACARLGWTTVSERRGQTLGGGPR
jgi:hypothetical protein